MMEKIKEFAPDPFQYDSFQNYLQALVNYFKTVEYGPKTNGEWAQRLGYKSPRSFGMILKGERLPSEEMIFSLSKYLRLNLKKKNYIHLLVKLEKKRLKGTIEQVDLDQLRKANPKNSSFREINLNQFNYISNWYYLPLRQFFIHPFHETMIHTISSIFENTISTKQIEEAIKIMIEQGFLQRDHSGFIKIDRQGINTPSDISSNAIIKHHTEMLDQAKIHLKKDHVENREFQSLTFRCKDSDLKAAKEAIREFKEDFNKRFANDQGDEVFQLGIQFFKHTHSQDKEYDH